MKPSISIEVVQKLHSVLAGDPATEQAVLDYIMDKWGAKSLCYLPPKVAAAILDRPGKFLVAVNEPF